ncbi:hypothetical protein AMATHDRAFT_66470 [Amanita thiersii Skay4041]|uniref:Major facilitator superfamily (MFS) profile domain-containing protein n=1 Tax=Amanita thiersii Skay4041 TaxID=703135 RepID=A0A2A9NJU2_9AGAR|nr:hypothetical protein AMATHDRAFT_66470 [Amanita thiersii Skay4041]
MTFKKQMKLLSEHRNAYLLAGSAAMGSIFYGWDMGLIGGVLSMESFQQYFGLDTKTAAQRANLSGNIVGVLQAGSFFGALLTGYFSSKWGRKPSLIASGLVYLVGSLIQSIAGLGSSQAVALRVLYFSRFMGGFGVGMVSVLVPSYVSECTPQSIRGRCTGMAQFANNIGIMLSFWVNYGTAKNLPYGEMQWRLPFIIQMVPGVLFVIAMSFQPESPRWLVEHGYEERAAKSLAFASRTTVDSDFVVHTIKEIKSEFDGKAELPLWKQFVGMAESRSIFLRCAIPAIVMTGQQWTGTNAVNYFSPQIFASLGVTGTTAGLFATGIYGVAKAVSVGLVLIFGVESIGRKRCMLIGGLGQGATMLWIGGFSGIHRTPDKVPASYVSIIAVYLYGASYGVGWGPLPWVIAGEVAPNHLRTAANSIAIGFNWLFAFIISKITPIMLENIKYGTFLLFGVCCLLLSVWVYVFLPETKGIALEDIKYIFEKDLVRRALQDAPGGWVFVGKREEKIMSKQGQSGDDETHKQDGRSSEKSSVQDVVKGV